LIKVDAVNYTLGPFGSSYTLAAINVTESLDKIIVFSQAADDSLFNNAKNPTVTFGLMSPASDYMHQILALLASKPTVFKTMVVLRSTSGFTTSVWNGMLGLLPSYPNLVILANVTYPPGTPSDAKFQPLVASLQKAVPNPDIFVSLSFLNEGPYVTSAIRHFNYQPTAIAMTSANNTDGNSLYAIGPEQWNVHQTLQDSFYGSTAQYNTDYLNMFPNTGEAQVSLYSAGASASGYVIASAISAAPSLSQTDVRNALESLNNGTNASEPFQTFYGPVLFTPVGQNSAKEMVVTQCSYNSQNKLEGILVAPPYEAAQALLLFAYGCNTTGACNFVPGAIQNGTNCTFPKPGSTLCKGASSSISYSFSALFFLILSVFLFTYQ